jgi:hypothetical protein
MAVSFLNRCQIAAVRIEKTKPVKADIAAFA